MYPDPFRPLSLSVLVETGDFLFNHISFSEGMDVNRFPCMLPELDTKAGDGENYPVARLYFSAGSRIHVKTAVSGRELISFQGFTARALVFSGRGAVEISAFSVYSSLCNVLYDGSPFIDWKHR